MSLLWLPEKTPPQVSAEAQQKITQDVLQEGAIPLFRTGFNQLESQEPLGEYIGRFGYDLNTISDEGLWPERALKIGASLAYLAYRETGYFQTINEDVFEMTQAIAEIDGIPEAYFSSLYEDFELCALMQVVTEAPDLTIANPEGFRQVVEIGAGCVRFYLQPAVAA